MHHSDVDYWRHLQALQMEFPKHRDLPSPRVCRLLLRTFERWKGRPGWLREEQVGHLFCDRADIDEAERCTLAGRPLVIRKALAVQRMLEIITDPRVAVSSGSAEVSPDELIVGTLPPFSVGQGKEFVRYLTKPEELDGALSYLNELSPMGHIVPDHGIVLAHGLEAMAEDCRRRAAEKDIQKQEADFLEAVALSLQAVVAFAGRYAEMVRAQARRLPEDDVRRGDLERVAACLDLAPRGPAQTFHQALQAIYLMHCALHWTVEIVPIGRLDQLLGGFYEKGIADGSLTPDNAQELIDCFWIKLDERVILNPRHAENRFSAADGVLTGFFGPSNYDQGCLLNQWMQQITIGGLKPTAAERGDDASNAVTRLCLAAARRLPLNSPTLDLRVHAGTPDEIITLAAEALMSGGAHPVILNDDVIVPALMAACGREIPLADARDYACDGCYETMVAGKSEFSFSFVSALDLIEKTLNRGAGLRDAGAALLRGAKNSWRSPNAADIPDFAAFQAIWREHCRLACHRYLRNLTSLYGNKAGVCPSPLLSALIGGCVDSKRDLTAGGALYHIFSPLLVGVSSAADSLHVIETLVFRDRAFSLAELTTCLATDWQEKMMERDGLRLPEFGGFVADQRIRAIRELCLAQPKFGHGEAAVDQHGWWLLETFVACVREAYLHPVHAASLADLKKRFGTEGRPFEVTLAPGVGTFEQYAFSGSFNGASADGRRSAAPIASDLSPAPVPSDRPAMIERDGRALHSRQSLLADGLRSYRHPVLKTLGDGAPVDFNLREDHPVEDLARTIRAFAGGDGGSICTFTVADPETFAAAQIDPERYNLVRVRMGGWTEFFVTLFPDHQEQHKRRPLYVG